MVTFCVYALCDDSGICRYVGKTGNLPARFKKHLWLAQKGAVGHKYAWLRKLLRENRMPRVVELEGGEGVSGLKHSLETRARLKAAVNSGRFKSGISRPMTEEHRRNIGLASTGRVVTSATRDKIRAAQHSRTVSQLADDGTIVARFPSTSAAARAFGCSLGNIQRAANTGCRVRGWRFSWN